MAETETPPQQQTINATSLLLFGLCLIFIGAGGYYYYKYQNAVKTQVATNNTNSVVEQSNQTENPVVQIEEEQPSVIELLTEEVGTVSGKICFPGSYIPEGKIALKNIETDEVETFPNPSNQSTYEVNVPAGSYHARYQAYMNGMEGDFQSGYYTKCAIDSTADVCNAPDGHALIEVEIENGGTVADVALCDFYYETEPAF